MHRLEDDRIKHSSQSHRVTVTFTTHRTMSPSDYIGLRSDGPSNDPSYSEIVEDKPYFPFLRVDANDEESIKNAAIMIVQSMKDVSVADLSIKTVLGGNTNGLFCVSQVMGGITNRILVRIFGAPGLIDRDIENSNYAALAKRGIAPRYYGRFANGRVEGWLDMKHLEVAELGNFNKQIAEQLGKLHVNFVLEPKEEPNMWSQLRSWMDQALVANFQNETDQQRAAKLDVTSLPAELGWLQESVVPKDAKTAFCHNDALAANILVSSDLKDIQLIDFEYGGPNYVAFDIANHFNEYAGGTDNGVPMYELFPTEEKQREFLVAYLLAVNGKDPTETEVNALCKEVQAFVLVNHLYWGLWAVNQAAVEGCSGFDYLLYAKHRIGRYGATKN
jgi:thiamine kinase-like enzyme